MLSHGERAALIHRYAEGPALLRAALATVPAEALQWRPAAGEWSAHEVIVHCADSEAISVGRIRYVLAERDVRIAGYDEAAWAIRFDYHALPLEPALATLTAVRANTVPLIERLTDDDWARAGEHSESGRYSAEDWLRIYAEHLELHARQIEANVAAWREQTSP
jgi:predicted NBD/HSP70 family sugar kinase